ncbi:MAG: CvpA family protein [Defluviitaleaceae bacterium]|nr:CvpA family protein [Defluviitaleaceae bacterium]
MNTLDIVVLVLIALCALAGYRQGLVRTVYRLASFFIAVFLAQRLFPYVARMLRGTRLYETIQESIKSGLNLEGFVADYAAAGRSGEIIEALPLPINMRNLLQERFVEGVHGVLQVDTVEAYISGFFANIAINGIAMVLVFLLVLIILAIAGMALDIVHLLPVISTFNRIGGLGVGILLGVGIAWISIVVMSMFFATSANPEVYDLLHNSFSARLVLSSVMPALTAVA